MNCVSSPSNDFSEACIDGKAGNVVVCGKFSIPSLIDLSPSVISIAVAFCVSVIGLKNFDRSVYNCCSPVLSLSRLSRIFFLVSKYSFTIKSLLTGSLIFNKRANMALDRSPDFLRLLLTIFFFCRLQGRIYKNFFKSVQCKKPPFTNTMFIDRSKFQKQF